MASLSQEWTSDYKQTASEPLSRQAMTEFYELPTQKPEGFTDADWERHKLAAAEYYLKVRQQEVDHQHQAQEIRRGKQNAERADGIGGCAALIFIFSLLSRGVYATFF